MIDRRFIPLVAVVMTATLSACAPNLGPKPQPAAPGTYATARTFGTANGDWPAAEWWKAYGDPQLDGLIAEAIAGSPNLKIAEARLRAAVGVSEIAHSTFIPHVQGDASVDSVRRSLNEGLSPQFQQFLPHGWHTEGHVDANITYELDYLGKNRAAFAAAKADQHAAEAEVSAAYLALSTSVASAYADLIRLTADRAAAADAVRVRRDTSGLVSARAKQDLENQGQVSLAESGVADARADLAAIDSAIARTRNQIAALLGKGPDRGLDVALPAKTDLVPIGVPPDLAVDLVGRRPDIVIARLHAEAAAKRIDVINADYYPNIDFKALIGYESLDVSDLFEKASIIGHIGPAIHLPIFGAGLNKGRYRQARARYDEAVATYDMTLTDALREVADALADQKAVNEQLTHARDALTASENAYRVAGLRYKGGLSRYIEVLTAEDRVLIERRAVADLEARAFSQDIALIRALGGGFTAPNS